MDRSRAVLTFATLASLAAALSSPAGAAEVRTAFSITADGQVVAEAPANAPDPSCLGPLSLISNSVLLNNAGSTPANVHVTVALNPGLHVDPGVDCSVTLGTCSVTDPETIDWTVTVPGMNSASMSFAVRVDADVPSGTQVCETITASVDSDTPIVLKSCATTNSSNQCGLGAPALSDTSLALLILALGAAGILVLSRRAS